MRTLQPLALALAGIISLSACGTAPASGPSTIAPTESYLFALSAESGHLAGVGADTGTETLTLTLQGVRDHASQFADRPIRKAYVLPTADLVANWNGWFADADPNAILTYLQSGDAMPHSIVLTVSDPSYDPAAGTFRLSARHLHRQAELSPTAATPIPLPNTKAPTDFTSATLYIDGVNLPAAASGSPAAVITTLITDLQSIAKAGGSSARLDQRLSQDADFTRLTGLLVGRYWKEATPLQQRQLTDAVHAYLVKTQISGWVAHKDADVHLGATVAGSTEDEQIVQVELNSGGRTTPVEFFLAQQGGRWVIYNLAVGGSSAVTKYQSSFQQKIKKSGIDGLISSLTG